MRTTLRFEKGSLLLVRVAGIDVWVHWSWAVVAYFRIKYRLFEYGSPVWTVVEYLTVFFIVVLHEFGHALACRQVGGTANRIVLWPLGGIAFVNPPQRAGAYLWSIAAGPLVNLILVPITFLLFLASTEAGWKQLAPDVHRFIYVVGVINLGLLIFNMLPIYPLDGGQILRSLLWFPLGPARSLMAASIVGVIGSAGMLTLAIVAMRWWLGVLAAFAIWSSLAGIAGARTMLRRLKAPRYPQLTCPSCKQSPPAGDFWLCSRCRTRFDTFKHGGVCPRCQAQFAETVCPDCNARHPLSDWFAGVWQSTEVVVLPEHDQPEEGPQE